MTETSKTHVILLSCGSFNPITKGHIHMFGECLWEYGWGKGGSPLWDPEGCWTRFLVPIIPIGTWFSQNYEESVLGSAWCLRLVLSSSVVLKWATQVTQNQLLIHSAEPVLRGEHGTDPCGAARKKS
ncbi:hypothetical protein ATANTOWER_024242 [Ataeniobius toweri]|uniref:Cytidyltransferase-like domain-containing protein n=1 Tax=Ataeniobius toweri TaxID=208326 RepID=A0ABU7C0S2_9TELE|nr:hypothetical protein [Ataeniobius toweri]